MTLIKEYFKKKSKLSIFFDVLFILLMIVVLIPQSRGYISANAIRLFALGPSVNEEMKTEAKPLSLVANYWQFKNENGKELTLDELKGKPVFFNLWATWCPPCIGEMPSIQKLYDVYKDQVHFVLLTNEDPTKVKAFMKKKGWDIPISFYNTTLPDDLNSKTIPMSLILNSEGKEVLRHQGPADWNSKKVRKLLDEI